MTTNVLLNLKIFIVSQVNFYEKLINSLDDDDYYDEYQKECLKDIHTEYSLALKEINDNLKDAYQQDTVNLLLDKYKINLKE